jgi:hypothetical protein
MTAMTQDRLVEDAKFAFDLLDANVKPRQVEKDLVAQGVEPARAAQIVAEVVRMREEQGLAPAGNSAGGVNIVLGLVLLVVGVGVTVYTYTTASPGETYTLALGPIGFGLWRLVRGFTQN